MAEEVFVGYLHNPSDQEAKPPGKGSRSPYQVAQGESFVGGDEPGLLPAILTVIDAGSDLLQRVLDVWNGIRWKVAQIEPSKL